MSIINILILQIIAHLLADFTFQNDKLANHKNEFGFKSKYLKWHILIVFIISWLLSFQMKFIFASLVISLTHWLIDGLKNALSAQNTIKKYAFFIDQAIHIFVITCIVLLYNYWFICVPVFPLHFNTHYLLIFTGYLLCTKPANIFIKEVLTTYGIKIDKEGEILNAGKLIGTTERIISLTLILFGQFAAVGFIIAGKSILRFKDSDISRSEYLLIGTLLSFGIAILTGIWIQLIT